MLNPFRIVDMFRAEDPAPPESYSHIDWSKQQAPASAAILGLIQTQLNPVVHRCRIGKITLKTKA